MYRCDQCGGGIPLGTEYVCVNLHREVCSEDTQAKIRTIVTVLEATVLVILCMNCARSMSPGYETQRSVDDATDRSRMEGCR